MATLLIKNASRLLCFDQDEREISDGALFIRDQRIVWLGKNEDLPLALQTADEIFDATNHVVLPGLVNTHHHMYQSLTRVIPAAQNCELFNWLTTLYPLWARITPEMLRLATQVAMAELLLSGCTTSADHLYLYPNGCRMEDTIEAAAEMGMRFHPTRGAMSVGVSKGGLPPDSLVEDESAILADMARVVERYHDATTGSMLRIGLAPCSPFSVSQDLMRQTARLARHYKVGLHTHLAENIHDINYTREKFGCTPAEYAEELGWLGADVWHAHCVQLDSAGIAAFAQNHTGIAHCPCSNMRLASGIAPTRAFLDAGIKVGLGVDGSASNDGAHMLGEARQAMLLARVGGCDPTILSARTVLKMATLGGAQVLQRDDIGRLAEGYCADVVAFNVGDIEHAGGLADPVASLIFCAPVRAALTVVNGRILVKDGRLLNMDLPMLVERHNQLAQQLYNARG